MRVTTVTDVRVVSSRLWRFGALISAVLSSLFSNAPAGSTVATLSVQGSDDSSFTWSLTNNIGGAVQINTTTGEVTLVSSLSAGVYSFGVQVVGSPSGNTTTKTVLINVAEPIETPGVKITVPAQTETLVDFPLYVDLADMPAAFWSNADSDGGNLRVYGSNGTTPVPFDLAFIDGGNQIGALYVKTTLSSTTETSVNIKYDGTNLLPVTDTYGRNAVWSDYEVVVAGTDKVDRTGNYSLTETGTVSVDGDGLSLDEAELTATLSSPLSTWTATIDYLTGSSVGGTFEHVLRMDNGSSLVRLYNNYSVSPDAWWLFDDDNGSLNSSNRVEPVANTRYTLAMSYVSGSGYRILHANGYDTSRTDSGNISQHTSGTQSFYIGNGTTPARYTGGVARYASLRATSLSTVWVDAEDDNHRNSSTFYTSTVTVASNTGSQFESSLLEMAFVSNDISIPGITL